ncbi:MAG: hypothetical protein J6Z14_00640 [Prevotella sp.]|nr:hypothetical protein [Prevotella sp.]
MKKLCFSFFLSLLTLAAHADDSTTYTIPKDCTWSANQIREFLNQYPNLEQVLVEEGNPLYSSNNGLLCNKAGDSLVYVPYNYIDDKGIITIPKGIHVIPSGQRYWGETTYGTFARSEGINHVVLMDSVSYVWFPSCKKATLQNVTPPTRASLVNCPMIIIVPKGSAGTYALNYYDRYVFEETCDVDEVLNLGFLAYSVYDRDGDGVMEPVEYENIWCEPNGGLMYWKYESGYYTNYLYKLTDDNKSVHVSDVKCNYIDDFDNDGRIDCGFVDSNGMTLYMQQTDGSFIGSVQYVTSDEGDVNASTNGNTLLGIPNLRDGMFVDSREAPSDFAESRSPMKTMVWTNTSSSRSSSRVGQCVDLNKDGIQDFITSGNMYYSLCEPDSFFCMSAGNNKVYPYDVDGDGEVDYVCYDGTTLYIITGVTSTESNRQELYKNSVVDQVLFRDFDHDGDIDILAFLCPGYGSQYYNNSRYSYFVFLRNNGNGTFRRKEVNFADLSSQIISCGDYDADGCYEILLNKIVEPDKTGNVCDELLMKVNADFTISQMSSRFVPGEFFYNGGGGSPPKYKSQGRNTIIGDFDGDGLSEFYSLGGTLYGHLSSQAKTNSAPKKMAAPTATFLSDRNRLNITWQRGEDAETSACDLTYELRIGTQPGQGDVLYAESSADGRRLTTREGKQGTNLYCLFNAASLHPGKYYISVQAIDQGGLGGPFSDEFVYEHEMQKPVFAMDSKSITTADTLAVYAKSLVAGATYEWTVTDGMVVEWDGNTAKLAFFKQGNHEVGLSVIVGSKTYKANPKTVYTSALKSVTRSDFHRPVLDMDQDGLIDAIGYRNVGDGSMERIAWSTFADITKCNFVTDYDRDGYPDFTVANCSKGDVFLNYGEQDLDFDYQTVGMTFPPSGYGMTDLNNDGLLDSKNVDGNYSNFSFYSTTDGKTYEKIEKKNPHYYIYTFTLYDVNRDGFPDLVYGTYDKNYTNYRICCCLKDKTADFNYGEPQVLFQIPDSLKNTVFQIADYNSDGYVDMALYYSGSLYIFKGKARGNSSEVVAKVEGVGTPLRTAMDVNNDGCPDIPDLKNGKALFFHSDFSYELGTAEPAFNSLNTFSPQQGFLFSDGYLYKTNISNVAPQAPATVAAKQTADGLLITWSDATDDHTPAMQMRYNVSVKRKGKTGKNAFLISPMNGLMDAAAIVPDYDYKKSTQMLVPASVLTTGETYEVQVQAIDLWGLHSPMTKTVECTIDGSSDIGDTNGDGKIDVADIATILSCMAGQTAGLNSQQVDVNSDGKVDVADIATVLSIMASRARMLKMENGGTSVDDSY